MKDLAVKAFVNPAHSFIDHLEHIKALIVNRTVGRIWDVSLLELDQVGNIFEVDFT